MLPLSHHHLLLVLVWVGDWPVDEILALAYLPMSYEVWPLVYRGTGSAVAQYLCVHLENPNCCSEHRADFAHHAGLRKNKRLR